MAWSGKIIGTAIGTAIAGPIGAALGAGLGHLLDAAEDADQPITIPSFAWVNAVRSSGPGMLAEIAISPASSVPPDAELALWLMQEDAYVEGRLEPWTDEDGNVCASGTVQGRRDGKAIGSIFLPWAALPRLRGECVCTVQVLRGDQTLASADFVIELPKKLTRERRNVLGALVYAITAMLEGRATAEPELELAFQLLTDNFDLDEIGQDALQRMLERDASRSHSFDKVVDLVRSYVDEGTHEHVLELLEEIGAAAGDLPDSERQFIEGLALALGFEVEPGAEARGEPAADAGTSADETAGASSPDGVDPVAASYSILELGPDATWEQVRASYRRLASEYHPDKVQNLAKGFREYATNRMQEINVAYAVLKRHLNR